MVFSKIVLIYDGSDIALDKAEEKFQHIQTMNFFVVEESGTFITFVKSAYKGVDGNPRTIYQWFFFSREKNEWLESHIIYNENWLLPINMRDL